MAVLLQVTFFSICKVFRTHSEKDMSTISRSFLKLITDCDGVRDREGKNTLLSQRN